MGAYETDPGSAVARRRRVLIAARLIVYAGGACCGLAWGRAEWLRDLAKIAALLGLATAYSLWRSWRRGRTAVVITPEAIRRTDPSGRERALTRSEIVGVSSLGRGRGLVVRAALARKSLVVPGDLGRLDECLAEMVWNGVPRVPPQRFLYARVWAVAAVFWSLVALFVAESRAIEVAAAAVGVVGLAALWLIQRANPREAAGTCPVPTAEERSRAQGQTRRWAVGMCAAGVALTLIEAWWSHDTDNPGLGVGVLFLGVLFYGSAFFSGRLRVSALALVALVAAAAAIGGLVLWLAPGSDLGGVIAVAIILPGLLMFVIMSLVGRAPWLVAYLELIAGLTMVGTGIFEQVRHHHQQWLLIAGGSALTAIAIGLRTRQGRDVIVALAGPLQLAVAAALVYSVIARSEVLAAPALLALAAVSDAKRQARTPAS